MILYEAVQPPLGSVKTRLFVVLLHSAKKSIWLRVMPFSTVLCRCDGVGVPMDGARVRECGSFFPRACRRRAPRGWKGPPGRSIGKASTSRIVRHLQIGATPSVFAVGKLQRVCWAKNIRALGERVRSADGSQMHGRIAEHSAVEDASMLKNGVPSDERM